MLLSGLKEYRNKFLNKKEIESLGTNYSEDAVVYSEFADYVMEHHNHRNRPINILRRNTYAKSMTEGTWELTHQGIAFDTNFELVDGQNRLDACRLTGVPFQTKITWNVKPTTRDVVDQGLSRNIRDLCHFQGMTWVTQHHVSLAASMFGGPFYNHRGLDRKTHLEFLAKHAAALQFAWEILPHNSDARSVTNHAVRGVIARAYYHLDHTILRNFCDLLYSGMPSFADPAATVVITLRNRLMMGIRATNSKAVRDEIYQRTQNGLWLYARGEVRQQIAAITRDLFPLKN